MARTALSVQTIDRSGLNPSYTAANADGHSISNVTPALRVLLYVKNADAAGITVTLVTSKTVDGQAVADRTVTVPAGEDRIVGPFPADTYNQSDDTVNVDFSAVANITVAAFRLDNT